MPLKADIWTYADLIAHALDYMGAATDAQTERFARRAVQLAMDEMQGKRTWSYYYQIGHFNTVASYNTGTITYTQATKTATLAGGTWPTWAADGMLLISNVAYPIVSRVSNTDVVLAEANNPGADVAGGTSFTIYREAYTLPIDFGSMANLFRMNGPPFSLSYFSPNEFLGAQVVNTTPAQPFFYTITNDPNRHGVMAVRLRPGPNDVYPMSFVYRRRPRPMRVDRYEDGTVDISSASTTVTGNGTNWTSRLVGTMIRFSQDNENIPSGLSGSNPFWLERAVVGFTSATSMTLDAVPGETLSGVKYQISDPSDVEAGAMITYLCREIERQCRLVKRMKPTSDEEQKSYELSLLQAFEADVRRLDERSAMGTRIWPSDLLRYGPVLADN